MICTIGAQVNILFLSLGASLGGLVSKEFLNLISWNFNSNNDVIFLILRLQVN